MEFVPLDNRLQLPASRFSYLLQDWNQQLSVENPFNQVNKVLERILKLSQSIDSLERMAYYGSQSVEDFRNNLPSLEPEKMAFLFIRLMAKVFPLLKKSLKSQ